MQNTQACIVPGTFVKKSSPSSTGFATISSFSDLLLLEYEVLVKRKETNRKVDKTGLVRMSDYLY